MKMMRFIFGLMVGTALLQGLSFARESGRAPQQATAQSPDKPANDSSDEQNSVPARGEKEAGKADIDRKVTSPIRAKKQTSKHQTQSRAKVAAIHRSQSITTGGNATAGTNAIDSHMTRLAATSVGSTHVSSVLSTSNRKISTPSASANAAVNGQQFRPPRDPGARLAAVGGPLTASRGTAAINGTNMKRKP
jgi:hypothetical protein